MVVLLHGLISGHLVLSKMTVVHPKRSLKFDPVQNAHGDAWSIVNINLVLKNLNPDHLPNPMC